MRVYAWKGVFDKPAETDAGSSEIKGMRAISGEKNKEGVHVERGDESLRTWLESKLSESMAPGGDSEASKLVGSSRCGQPE